MRDPTEPEGRSGLGTPEPDAPRGVQGVMARVAALLARALQPPETPTERPALSSPAPQPFFPPPPASGLAPDPRTEERLLQAAHTSDPAVRAAALAELGALWSTRPVVALLSDLDNSRLRPAVIEALGRRSGAEAISLLDLLAHPDYDVRRSASRALLRAGEGALVATLAEVHNGNPEPFCHLADPRALGPLLRFLAYDDREVRGAAAGALASLGAVASPHLLPLLRGHPFGVRLAAAEVLGGTQYPEALAAFRELLLSGGEGDDLVGAVGLSHRGDPEALDPARQALYHPDAEVRLAAAKALGRLGLAGVRALWLLGLVARRDPDDEVQGACNDAVERIREAVRTAPAELEAAQAPEGRGTELEASRAPEGRGTELIRGGEETAP
ncbi:MAG: HEAT repeat domain-containing protein [Armatimonadetes bacterium]|nr:HEAT repeat domain-containing protein [Armatimonadota bacterium]